ncbi:MAG: MscL family protein [Candidatus Dependentiae bacterium]|nr:MscL family protein [Candidatus Dependentiae bacterium]
MWYFWGKQTSSEPSFVGQFKDFVSPHGSITGLAVYAALYTLASALVDNIILPVMGFFSALARLSKVAITLKGPVYGPHGEAVADAVVLQVGSFLQAFLNFLIVALVFFAVAQLCSAICYRAKRFLHGSSKTDVSAPSEKTEFLPTISRAKPPTCGEKTQEELLREIRDLLKQLNAKRRMILK